MTKCVIFLDVDGVLNRVSNENWGSLLTLAQLHQELPFVTEKNIVDMFNEALQDGRESKLLDVSVVISSTWRLHFDNPLDFCETTGVDEALIHEKDWRTGRPGDRGDQITEWLYRHPEVEQHVILDDNVYNFDEFKDKLNFVKTDETLGLTFDNYNRALKFFGVRMNRDYSISSLGGPSKYGVNDA